MNHLLQATVQKGNAVTTETYEYDYAGNRISKQVNEGNKTYYIIDESSGLAQVVAEVEITKDASNKETKNLIATYTLNGDERISVERDGNISYYIYDGHGNVRALTNQDGEITDTYSYDAYGNLLQAEGETKNDFLYTGEQYNASTGLYYLRARYMNPSTGTFISMDSYQGNTYDPITLHKYLYANANPVMNTDPTGYMALANMTTGVACRALGSSGEVQHNSVMISIAAHVMPLLRTTVAVGNAVIRLQDAIAVIMLAESLVQCIDDIDEKVKATVQEETKEKKGNYVVYTLVDDNGTVRYVGRTKDYRRRIREHENSPNGKIKLYGLKPGKKYENLTWNVARGLEQSLIVYHHTLNLQKDINLKGYNFTNGISNKNSMKDKYYNDTMDYMKNYPTMFENLLEEELNAIKEDMNAWW